MTITPPVIRNLWPLQAQCSVFYGYPYSHGFEETQLTHIVPPYEMTYEGKPIQHITIHRKCSESLARVLQNVFKKCDENIEHAKALGITRFSGSYCLRAIRGSSVLSMHAYGAAIDFDAEANPMCHDPKAGLFTPAHPLVIAFKEEGWIWGGDWTGRRDPMHFQAARIR